MEPSSWNGQYEPLASKNGMRVYRKLVGGICLELRQLDTGDQGSMHRENEAIVEIPQTPSEGDDHLFQTKQLRGDVPITAKTDEPGLKDTSWWLTFNDVDKER